MKLQTSYFRGQELIFTGDPKKSFRDGFFLLKIPDHIDLYPGIQFSKSFYKNEDHGNPYSGFKKFREVYFDREHFQTEHILIDGEMRKKLFPSPLIKLCDQMNNIGINILKNLCKILELPEKTIDKATANTLKNKGVHWFASSHYRSDRDLPGCAAHKDTGYVTVLYIDQEGLEAYINERWMPINPKKGYFIINFGASLELLTEQLSTPIHAIYHRVKKIPKTGKEDRYSFASFLNPASNLDLYKYSSNKDLIRHGSVKKFLEEFNKMTWKDDHDGFGISASAGD